MLKGIPQLTRRSVFAVVVILSIFIPAVLLFPATGSPAPTCELALMEPSELAQTGRDCAVLDARPRSEWQKGHIAGAHPFSWEDYTKTDARGVPYRVWPPEELAAALGQMGIAEDTPIVVYGDADKSWGGEGWACWVLAWVGHKGPIRFLAGGVQAWRAQGHPLTTEPEQPAQTPVTYRAAPRPELDIQAEEIQKNGASMVLIDTRSTLEYLTGHLPGAIHIPLSEFYSGKDRRPLSPDALRKLLNDCGVDAGKPVVYYCTGGVRSGYAWAVHRLSGLPPAQNYVGGMEDWKRRPEK